MLNKIKQAMKIRHIIPLVLMLVSMSAVSAQEWIKKSRVRAAELVPVEAVPSPVSKDFGVSNLHRWGRYICTIMIGEDTVPVFRMKDLNVYGSHLLLTSNEVKKNSKLIRNVKLMLPYAREAKHRLDVLEVEIAKMPVKDRKAALKKAEKDIEAEYKKDLKKRTYSQGLVLIKLIDRETSRSAYSLVNDLRGSLRAGLYQACARLFGYNLKDKFDPAKNSKDNLIDRIVKSIDYGAL